MVRQRQQLVGVFDDVGAVRIELDVPAVLVHARRDLVRIVRHVLAALVAHHAHAAHAKPGEPADLGRRRVVAQQRDAAEALRIFRQHVGEQRIVAAIAAGADDHRGATARACPASAMKVSGSASREV